MNYNMMKYCKVNIHPKSHTNSDLVINRKDFSDIKIGDIVEIYHPDDECSRLLLQVTVFKEDLQGKDVVSVEHGVASTFQLRPYSDVVVRKVDFHCVILDSVEVTFRDQYLGRSEMWRLKNSLVRTCVYLNKKIEFCNGTARIQVYEMWFQGERVTSGVINEETKIVFRSSTSMVYLFVQMSSEMWEFDVHGDLYFEKAVNGFLSDLFQKWKKHGSNHEVTIVLFSRVFYKANSIEEFPDYMCGCVQKDYKNQFYEDFYRVAVQNEKYDDWSSSLVLLQSLFTEYRKTVLEYHKKPGFKIPFSFLSTAAHGNFLEVLNISLNVFEKHYLDRSLDRTGQLSVVISPGVGVFEVDRELTNVTKQRIIDNGVGCDLVCVGEQPLHAVPLFKFHNKDTPVLMDDYSMPHWINLSFYSGNKKQGYCKFVPRIRLPSRRIKTSSFSLHLSPMNNKTKLPTSVVEETSLLGCSVSAADVDYTEYDAQVFTLPSSHIANAKFLSRTRKSSCTHDGKILKWKLSDPDIYRSHLSSNNDSSILRSHSIAINETRTVNGRSRASFSFVDNDRLQYQEIGEDDVSTVTNNPVGSSDSSNSSFSYIAYKNQLPSTTVQNTGSSTLGPGKALINPFDPSHVTVKVTSNRRRWTHVFPKGPSGIIIQQHHYQPECSPDNEYDGKYRRNSENEFNSGTEDDFQASELSPTSDCRMRSKTSTFVGSPTSGTFLLQSRKSQTLLWGATGEQQWTPTLTTGVDWKALVIPACLPITTDFFPDEVSLNNDYLVSDYNLLPDDVNADYARKRAIYRDPLTTQQVFLELISQRLAQGFQLIVENDVTNLSTRSSCTVVSKGTSSGKGIEYKLSIGRIYHKISLCKSEIRITRYRPKHPYPPFIIQYRYRFQAPDHITYSVSWASFNAEKLENYNWNYIDHYICTRGDTDFPLIESCKFWRFRLYALPTLQPGTKKIFDGSQYCDVYSKNTNEEKKSFLESFLKFTESAVNKIRRMSASKPATKMAGNIGNNSPYRERGGSINRTVRPKSVSKMLEKQKFPPIADIVSPMTMSLDSDNCDVFDSSPESPKTKESLTNIELLEMITNPNDGISFISKSPSLPSNTFISYDAVQWFKKHIECDEIDAVQQLEDLRKEKLICHASGDFSHPFIYGFYLYYVPRRDEKNSKDRGDFTEPIYDLRTFKNEWAEVQVRHVHTPDNLCPVFFRSELQNVQRIRVEDQEAIEDYKQAHLEVDVNGKSDRIEWGHYQYQHEYNVQQAYELIIQWMAASGPIVSDLIYNLTRKAQTYNLQLIPVPADPHALPYAMKSDPLRGPIFVPLDISCLWNSKNNLFEEYESESRLQRLLLLQEEIAIKYGFIPCKGGVDSYNHHIQYVHLTGNVFLLITSPLNGYWVDQDYFTQLRTKRETGINSEIPEHCRSVISPHQEYIRRHITEYHDDKYNTDQRVGYLWSWNHMIGRRWKGANPAINDEAFQDKLLRDFRKFCSNDENRLRRFWDKCNSLKDKG